MLVRRKPDENMIIRGSKESGTALIVILVTMVLIGITMASYLQLVSNQNISVVRSMAWNSAISTAEAGIEDAMAHLNYNTTNRTVDGWTVDGTNVVKERVVAGNKYRVYISKDLEPPIIKAEGYAWMALKGKYLAPRSVRVTTTNDALFAKGMVAKGRIDLSGNKLKTDSFDSTDPNYNTNGKYDPAKNKDGGDIATNSSVEDSLNLWNAEIYGTAATGPGGNVKLGANGSVGTKTWVSSGTKGLEPGRSRDDMNVYFPDVKRPWSGIAFPPIAGTVSGTNYNYVLGDGNYQMEDLELASDQKIYITGNAKLLVTDEIDITGNAQIIIAPGASLQLYMEGETAKIAGNGLANNNNKAGAFSYWGLPSNKNVMMAGNATLTGTIYAPQAELVLGGGGSNTYDFMGAAVANSVKFNGHYQFHYDESLKFYGPKRGYTITSWNEAGISWNEL